MALARSAARAGIDYPHLLQLIVKIALEGPSFDVGVPMLGLMYAKEPAAGNGTGAA